MTVMGRYVGRDVLATETQLPVLGELPAVRTTFTFIPLRGAEQTITCWALVDTGSTRIVVPSRFVGIVSMDDDSLHVIPDSVAARSKILDFPMWGVGGKYRGVGLYAEVRLNGFVLDEPVLVGVSTKLDYPIIGREILNRFVAQMNPISGDIALGCALPRPAI